MLVVSSLNCSYWWVLFNPLHETMHAYLKCSATVHTDRFFSLLQMGPFIDSDHPVMKKGTVDQSFHDIFYSEVLRKVGKCWFLKMLCWHIVKCKSNSSVIYFCSDSRLYPIFGEHCSCNSHSICAWCSPWLCFPSGLYFSLLRFRSGCVLKIRDSDLI